MRWKKIGLIIRPQPQFDWSKTHASLPFAHQLSGERYRIYFGGRNSQNLTQTGWVEIDLNNPSQILDYSSTPALGLGELGTFDDSAVFPSWIVSVGKELWLYYVGWMRGVTVPFYASLGLAISGDGGRTFKRYSPAPILSRDQVDPYFTASACVLRGPDKWQMWYTSNTKWAKGSMGAVPRYHVKYAESNDGLLWKKEGVVAVDFKDSSEIAITRPSIEVDNGKYSMWYSYRGANYRIGYAESPNGIEWQRKDDQVGVTVSSTEFESEMVAYTHIFRHGSQKFMLYNGNGFGRDGIALAVLE
jgi:predicted GH43/DUF377 family glycosyl hydrolase